LWAYQHNKVNALVYIATLFVSINFLDSVRPLLTMGTWDNILRSYIPISSTIIITLWFILYTLTFYFFTVVSPDIDTESSASHAIGILGWFTSRLLTHRGITHSMIPVTVVFGIASFFIGSWFIAGWIAWMSHILCDLGSTGVKRINPF
jgi:membrane-bound metal-dependent hydrolase YbcI (DUF457 family)